MACFPPHFDPDFLPPHLSNAFVSWGSVSCLPPHLLPTFLPPHFSISLNPSGASSCLPPHLLPTFFPPHLDIVGASKEDASICFPPHFEPVFFPPHVVETVTERTARAKQQRDSKMNYFLMVVVCIFVCVG